ncbi:MAG: hypothetical protein ACXWV1_07095, partial [Chitinophagaceae bacterium]
DINGAPVFGEIIRLNIFPLGPDQNLADTFITTLPQFPSKDNGEITFQLAYNRLKESRVENDTFIFRFAVTDLAGNKSDTVISEQVVIHL